jgi:hypothetical protein
MSAMARKMSTNWQPQIDDGRPQEEEADISCKRNDIQPNASLENEPGNVSSKKEEQPASRQELPLVF